MPAAKHDKKSIVFAFRMVMLHLMKGNSLKSGFCVFIFLISAAQLYSQELRLDIFQEWNKTLTLSLSDSSPRQGGHTFVEFSTNGSVWLPAYFRSSHSN